MLCCIVSLACKLSAAVVLLKSRRELNSCSCINVKLPVTPCTMLCTDVPPGALQYAGEALKVSGVPSVVLAPAIGTIVGAARGLLPWG